MPDQRSPHVIIGATGALGFGLAVRLAHAGLPIVIGSRAAERAEQAAGALREAVPGADARGLHNDEAAAAGDIVFLSVPFSSQAETIASCSAHLRPGALLVDATVPLAAAVGGKATRTIGVWQGSVAQQAQELVPDGVRVISALHTVSAAALADLGHKLDEDVLVCGQKRADKRRVAQIIDRVDGLRCVDAGPLEAARIVEPLTALLIGINGRYRTHAGIRITGLPGGDLFPPLAK